jgi:hypothetical protein
MRREQKDNSIHLAHVCTGTGKWFDHFVFDVHNIFLLRGCFQDLNPWLHGHKAICLHLRIVGAFYYVRRWLTLYTHIKIVCINFSFTHMRIIGTVYYIELLSVSRKGPNCKQFASTRLYEGSHNIFFKNKKHALNNTKALIRGLQMDTQCYLSVHLVVLWAVKKLIWFVSCEKTAIFY